MTLKERIKLSIMPIVNSTENILSVYLLGSVSRGDYTDNSDIDIGIIIKNDDLFSNLQRIEISNLLSYNLGRSVDLGLISSKNLIYASEAIFKGELLYTKNSDINNIITSTLIGLFFQLNVDRKEILDAYRA